MRNLQICVLFVGLAVFIAAIFFAGAVTGDILWRVGIAALLLYAVCIMLWPRPAIRNTATES